MGEIPLGPGAQVDSCALAPVRSMSEKQGGFIDEAEAIAVWIQAVKRSLVPRARLDWGDLLRTGNDGSLIHGVEFVRRKVQVVRDRAERPGGLHAPVDQGDDHFSAMEVEATRDGVIRRKAEDALIKRTGDADLRYRYRDSKDAQLGSPFVTIDTDTETIDRLAHNARGGVSTQAPSGHTSSAPERQILRAKTRRIESYDAGRSTGRRRSERPRRRQICREATSSRVRCSRLVRRRSASPAACQPTETQ